MYHLSNAEVFHHWKSCKKQTAKDYWHGFLLTRVRHGDKDAKQYTNFIKQALNAQEGAYEKQGT